MESRTYAVLPGDKQKAIEDKWIRREPATRARSLTGQATELEIRRWFEKTTAAHIRRERSRVFRDEHE